ncbi:MAG: VOC family protein [Phyllobacterium sp.]
MKLTRRNVVGGAGIMAIGTMTGEPMVSARAESKMSEQPFAVTTPTFVSKVGLKAKNADALASYYKDVVGLTEFSRNAGKIVLGAPDKPLFEIEQFSAAREDDPRSAGLYHTAFLLPTRADLARWTRHAIDRRIPIVGASDHFVSEAVYLTDPEGNGIEIYADRPKEAWTWNGKHVNMGTVGLDVGNLLTELKPDDKGWQAAPELTAVGHVHLRVGSAPEAESWWNENMNFDTVQSLGSNAVFLSTGGYHHHVGANSWQSRGAKHRDPDRTGLGWVEFQSSDAKEERTLEDPWGNVIRILPIKV